MIPIPESAGEALTNRSYAHRFFLQAIYLNFAARNCCSAVIVSADASECNPLLGGTKLEAPWRAARIGYDTSKSRSADPRSSRREIAISGCVREATCRSALSRTIRYLGVRLPSG